MKKMDDNGDNQISKEEFHNALTSAGSSNYKTLSDYCKALIKKFDTNKDGLVSYLELAEGLRELGIKVFKGEQAAMMRRIDEERAGVISYDGLFKALSRV